MDPETGGATAVAVLGVLAAVAEAAPPPLPLVLPVPPLPRNSKIYFYEKFTKKQQKVKSKLLIF